MLITSCAAVSTDSLNSLTVYKNLVTGFYTKTTNFLASTHVESVRSEMLTFAHRLVYNSEV